MHFEGAGDIDRAARHAARAADEAAQKLAFDRAARLYQRALDLEAAERRGGIGHPHRAGPRPRERRPRRRGRARLPGGRRGRPPGVLDLRRRVEFLRSGLFDEGIDQLDVLSSIGIDPPRTPAGAVAALLFRRAGPASRHRVPRAPRRRGPGRARARRRLLVGGRRARHGGHGARGLLQSRAPLLALQAGEPPPGRARSPPRPCSRRPRGAGEERGGAARGGERRADQPFVLAWSTFADGLAAGPRRVPPQLREQRARPRSVRALHGRRVGAGTRPTTTPSSRPSTSAASRSCALAWTAAAERRTSEGICFSARTRDPASR